MVLAVATPSAAPGSNIAQKLISHAPGEPMAVLAGSVGTVNCAAGSPNTLPSTNAPQAAVSVGSKSLPAMTPVK